MQADHDRTVFVTGGSSGIGAGLVEHLAADFDTVLTVARRIDRMETEYADFENVHPFAPVTTAMYPGPLSPAECHPTVGRLLDPDADGPTGRFFWLGYELPLFPELGDTDPNTGDSDTELFERVV